ncbi:MAG: DUF1735 domain-containing protein [Bacteroidetes bacterium]|nr:DUF1735 domain-containing protein [Bacteroidota bacterium]
MKNKIIILITLLASVVLLNSCLKDDADYWKDGVAGKMYATVLNSTLQSEGLAPVPDEVTFSFMVNIASDTPPSSDVTLTLAIDPDAVTAYNTQTGKAYLAYPTAEILTPTVTIAAGTRTAMVSFKVWGADALNACDNYIAAVTIKTVSDPNIKIASNMKSYLLSLPISNPYSGNYKCVGYRKHPTLGIFPVDKFEAASTVDCKTIRKSGMGDYPYDVTIEVTTETMQVLGVTCNKVNVAVIDPATNAYVASGYGQYDTFTGDATQVPIPASPDVNYYNPVTRTFVLNYYYNSAANRIAYEVLTRQ